MERRGHGKNSHEVPFLLTLHIFSPKYSQKLHLCHQMPLLLSPRWIPMNFIQTQYFVNACKMSIIFYLLWSIELLFPSSSYFWFCTAVEWYKSIVQDCQKWQKIWGEMSKGEWRLNKRRLAKCQLGEMFPKCGWKSKIYEETFLQKLSLRQAL